MWFLRSVLEAVVGLALIIFWLMWPEDRKWMLREIGEFPCPFDL